MREKQPPKLPIQIRADAELEAVIDAERARLKALTGLDVSQAQAAVALIRRGAAAPAVMTPAPPAVAPVTPAPPAVAPVTPAPPAVTSAPPVEADPEQSKRGRKGKGWADAARKVG